VIYWQALQPIKLSPEPRRPGLPCCCTAPAAGPCSRHTPHTAQTTPRCRQCSGQLPAHTQARSCLREKQEDSVLCKSAKQQFFIQAPVLLTVAIPTTQAVDIPSSCSVCHTLPATAQNNTRGFASLQRQPAAILQPCTSHHAHKLREPPAPHIHRPCLPCTITLAAALTAHTRYAAALLKPCQ
jgi:hypothetical protein